jgi:hypothetical protein
VTLNCSHAGLHNDVSLVLSGAMRALLSQHQKGESNKMNEQEHKIMEGVKNMPTHTKVPDEIAVASVTAACVIGLAVAFKNVFNVNAPSLFSITVPLYLFIVYMITRPTVQRFKHETLLWSVVIVLVSAFTLLFYVL